MEDRVNSSFLEHGVTQNFISSDTIGQIQVNRDIFYFNLTSSSSSGLNSTMVINMTSATHKQLINGAIVSCSLGNVSEHVLVHVSTNFPTSIHCTERCSYPVIGMNVIVDGYSSSGGLEGSQIWYHCETGFVPRDRIIATCSHNGSWTPDPANLVCEGTYIIKIMTTYINFVSQYT